MLYRSDLFLMGAIEATTIAPTRLEKTKSSFVSCRALRMALAPNQYDALVHDLCGQMRGDALGVMRRTHRVDIKGDKVETGETLQET